MNAIKQGEVCFVMPIFNEVGLEYNTASVVRMGQVFETIYQGCGSYDVSNNSFNRNFSCDLLMRLISEYEFSTESKFYGFDSIKEFCLKEKILLSSRNWFSKRTDGSFSVYRDNVDSSFGKINKFWNYIWFLISQRVVFVNKENGKQYNLNFWVIDSETIKATADVVNSDEITKSILDQQVAIFSELYFVGYSFENPRYILSKNKYSTTALTPCKSTDINYNRPDLFIGGWGQAHVEKCKSHAQKAAEELNKEKVFNQAWHLMRQNCGKFLFDWFDSEYQPCFYQASSIMTGFLLGYCRNASKNLNFDFMSNQIKKWFYMTHYIRNMDNGFKIQKIRLAVTPL